MAYQSQHLVENDIACFTKAQARADVTFTLVGQDMTSPAVVCEWIKQNIETAPPQKLLVALEIAIAMRRTAHRKDAD